MVEAPDTQCRLESSGVEHSVPAVPGADPHHHPAHGKEAAVGHKNHDREAQVHSGFEVVQSLRCNGGLVGRTVEIILFERFPGLEALRVEWVTDSSQGGASLAADRNTLRISS